jgi:hypothetical protein
MIIKRSMLRHDLPTERCKPDGGVNCVLALRSDSQYCATNTYLPKWMTSNVAYYLAHPEEFEGYIELEDVDTPEFLDEDIEDVVETALQEGEDLEDYDVS